MAIAGGVTDLLLTIKAKILQWTPTKQPIQQTASSTLGLLWTLRVGNIDIYGPEKTTPSRMPYAKTLKRSSGRSGLTTAMNQYWSKHCWICGSGVNSVTTSTPLQTGHHATKEKLAVLNTKNKSQRPSWGTACQKRPEKR